MSSEDSRREWQRSGFGWMEAETSLLLARACGLSCVSLLSPRSSLRPSAFRSLHREPPFLPVN